MTKRELDALVADVAKRCDRDLALAGAKDGGYMPVKAVSIGIISGYLRDVIDRMRLEQVERATVRKVKRERKRMVKK